MTRTGTVIPAASTAQSRLLEQLQAGGRLSLDSKSGRYVLTDVEGEPQPLDQRPVLAMLRSGALEQDMTGRCRAAAQ